MSYLRVDRKSILKSNKFRSHEKLLSSIQLIKRYGDAHYLVLCSKEGDTTVHQLLKKHTTAESGALFVVPAQFHEIKRLRNVVIKEIACGKEHTLLLSSLGQVHTVGGNTYGQLGYYTSETRHNPGERIVQGIDNIISVKAGRYHSMALNKRGQVYVFGKGVQPHDDGVFEPIQLQQLTLHTITAIEAGDAHCMALTNKGVVLVWGCNIYGQTGLPTRRKVLQPSRLFYHGETFKAMAAATAHSLLLTTSGKVLATGHNIENNLQQLKLPPGFVANSICLMSNMFADDNDEGRLQSLAVITGYKNDKSMVCSCPLGGGNMQCEVRNLSLEEVIKYSKFKSLSKMIKIVDSDKHNSQTPPRMQKPENSILTPQQQQHLEQAWLSYLEQQQQHNQLSPFEQQQNLLSSFEQTLLTTSEKEQDSSQSSLDQKQRPDLLPAFEQQQQQQQVEPEETFSWPNSSISFKPSDSKENSTSLSSNASPTPEAITFPLIDLDTILAPDLVPSDTFSPTESLARALNNADPADVFNKSSRVKFVFDNAKYIYAHSVLLTVYSDFFRRKFESEWKQQSSIELKGESFDRFLKLMTYIYTGDVVLNKMSIEELISLIILAHSVEARPGLIDKCARQLEDMLRIDNCTRLFNSVRQLEDSKGIALKSLKNAILEYITEHFPRVIITKDYGTQNPAYLLEINQYVNKNLFNSNQ